MSLISYHLGQDAVTSSVTLWNADMCSLNSAHDVYNTTSLIDMSVPGNRLYQNRNGDICLAEKSLLEITVDFAKSTTLYRTGAKVVHAASHFFSAAGKVISGASKAISSALSFPVVAAEEILAPSATATNEQTLCEQAKREAEAQEAKQKQEAQEAEKRKAAEEQRQRELAAAVHTRMLQQQMAQFQARQEVFWAQQYYDQARARGSSGVHEQINLDFAQMHARNAGVFVF